MNPNHDGENPYLRVEDDSPYRCQHVNSHGQCKLVQYPESTFCICHSGPHAKKRNLDASLKNYRLGRHQARVGQKAGSPTILTLRDEVAIVRRLNEIVLELCQTNMDQAIASSRISDLSLKIERLVNSCERLESKLGDVLAQDEFAEAVNQISEAVSRHAPKEYEAIRPRFEAIVLACQTSKLELERAQGHVSNYDFGKWSPRILELATNPQLKTLRDEIAIVRMVLEDRVNSCKTLQQIMLQSGPISEIVIKIEKLVTSCVRLELKNGQVLDKNQQVSAMQQIIEIIAECVDDPDKLEAIHNELAATE